MALVTNQRYNNKNNRICEGPAFGIPDPPANVPYPRIDQEKWKKGSIEERNKVNRHNRAIRIAAKKLERQRQPDNEEKKNEEEGPQEKIVKNDRTMVITDKSNNAKKVDLYWNEDSSDEDIGKGYCNMIH